MEYSRRTLLKAGGVVGLVGLVAPPPLSAQAPLLRRPIPASGEMLPVIGIGTARGYGASTGPEENARRHEVFRVFQQNGGGVIDTAPSYGTAEQVVGDLVTDLQIRPSLFLATKLEARREGGPQQLERSFQRLRTSMIDLVAVHNLLDTAPQLITLREAKQAGRIRYVGITTSSSSQHAEFERIMRAEPLDFIQVDYALDNREAGKVVLPLAADRGMAVMVNVPFGVGRLFRAVQGRPLPSWAANFDCGSWAQFFLKYIISHPAVTCTIPGTTNPAHLRDNLGAGRGRLPDPAMRQRMEQFIGAP
jgi:aryl-alcohol dehydrogenase-like predicted oxidoreductase